MRLFLSRRFFLPVMGTSLKLSPIGVNIDATRQRLIQSGRGNEMESLGHILLRAFVMYAAAPIVIIILGGIAVKIWDSRKKY